MPKVRMEQPYIDNFKKIHKTKYYFWVGNVSGCVWSVDRNSVPKPRLNERLKYLGWTHDVGWPRTLNTGRVLHKPSAASQRKKRDKIKNAGRNQNN